jgi:hypothetical protein
MATNSCCAECGEEGGASLKICGACGLVRYCNAECQKKHWPKHKIECKQRAAELRDEAVFKDPLAKEDCPICFLPMPRRLICCMSLSPATILSVPIYDFAEANKELADEDTNGYYPCCGKSICAGCMFSFGQSGNTSKCPFCNSGRAGKTEEEKIEDMMKRAEANDAASIYLMAGNYHHGRVGLQQDHTKAMDLYARAAELGLGKAHCNLGLLYHEGGDMKKAKFHLEAAAMAGHEVARYNLGGVECNSGNLERAVKHWTIAASAGDYKAMHELITSFKRGHISRVAINLTLKAYNNVCAEMRSDARDAYIRKYIVNN